MQMKCVQAKITEVTLVSATTPDFHNIRCCLKTGFPENSDSFNCKMQYLASRLQVGHPNPRGVGDTRVMRRVNFLLH